MNEEPTDQRPASVPEDARWWHASPEDRPHINAPDRCEHGVEDERRWVCRAGKVVYRD